MHETFIFHSPEDSVTVVTLYHLARRSEPGDQIRWKGEKSSVDKPHPRTVKRVIHAEGYITVEAEGPQGAPSRFRVEENDTSEAWFGSNEKPMGSVEVAELVDRNISTE